MPNDFTSDTDTTTAVASFVPLEADDLLQQLATVDDTWAGGASLYGPGGLFDATRKHKLSVIALQIRDDKAARGEKTTEAALDQLAHGDDTYKEFLDVHTRDRANWLSLDAERERIKTRLRLIQFVQSR